MVDIPDFFTRDNSELLVFVSFVIAFDGTYNLGQICASTGSKDANAQCTLVAISCKDFGARQLPSWTDPFETNLCSGGEAEKYEVVRITINEGRIAKLLSPFIVSGTKKNVAEKDHANTLLYYGDAQEMRDILRMHNIYTCYVFLLDGIGRVRWAGSGAGSDEEV